MSKRASTSDNLPMQLLNKKTVDKKQVNGLILESYFDSRLRDRNSEDKTVTTVKRPIPKDKLFSEIKDLLEDL